MFISFDSADLTYVRTLQAELLDQSYIRAMSPLLEQVNQDLQSSELTRALSQLETEAARLAALGEPLTPDNPALQLALVQVEAASERQALLLDQAGEPLTESGIRAAEITVRESALLGLTDAELDQIGASWIKPNPEAIQAAVNYTSSSAWREMIRLYAPDMVDMLTSTITVDILNGVKPQTAVKRFREHVETLLRYRADAVGRTLQLTAYRDAGVVQRVANADILEKHIRIAALDDRCCLACISQHGTELRLDERVDDHHHGRCDSISIVKGFPREIETGEQWLRRQSGERQKQIFGAGNYAAWQAGAVQLNDFVGHRVDDVFGKQIYQLSLRGVLGDDGATRFYAN